MAIVRVGALGLKTWCPSEHVFPLQGASAAASISSIKIKTMLVYSDFTKNPSKVLHLNFHRVIHFPDNRDSLNPNPMSLGKVTSVFNNGNSQNPCNARIVLKESSIYEKTTSGAAGTTLKLTPTVGEIKQTSTPTDKQQP